MVAFHLFIGAPNQEVPFLEAECCWIRGLKFHSVVVHYFKVTRELTSLLEYFPFSDSSYIHPLRDIWMTKKSMVRLNVQAIIHMD